MRLRDAAHTYDSRLVAANTMMHMHVHVHTYMHAHMTPVVWQLTTIAGVDDGRAWYTHTYMHTYIHIYVHTYS